MRCGSFYSDSNVLVIPLHKTVPQYLILFDRNAAKIDKRLKSKSSFVLSLYLLNIKIFNI